MPPIDPISVSYLSQFVGKWLRSHIEPITHEPSFRDWLDACPYTEQRKLQLVEARASYSGLFPSLKECRINKSFMKTETYMEPKFPRGINSRVDVFKAFSGPWFKSIEDVMYKNKHFIKHVPVPDRSAKIASLIQGGSRYFATDYTAFEAGIKPLIMEACECQLYSHMLQLFPGVADFINKVITGKNVCKYRGLRCTLTGTRMSGDMCTSLGNGFTNLMLFSCYCHCHGLEFDGFIEGDDGIFSCSGDARADPSFFTRLGQLLKIEEVEDPREASFCGLVFADQGIVRDPYKVLVNFGWTSSFIHAGKKVMLSLLRSKALSLAYECGSCPILNALARRALTLTRGARVTHRVTSYLSCPSDEAACLANLTDPSPATRALFARLYGIPPLEQERIEAYILRSYDYEPSELGFFPANKGISRGLHPALYDNFRNVVVVGPG